MSLRPGLMALLAAASCHGYMLGSPPARTAMSRAGKPVTLYAVEEGESLAETGNEPQELASSEPPLTILEESDLYNTRWQVTFTPRKDSWLKGGVQQQEFALLEDGSVVWGGQAGGPGTGGRWQLSGETLEVIRTTPLGLLTGRDYYMSIVRARVTEDLQFEVQGITRSYNAAFPVMVIADWTAKRLPGRFARDTGDDDDAPPAGPPKEKGEGLIDSSGFNFPRPGDFGLGS